jgi:hypothetical protein
MLLLLLTGCVTEKEVIYKKIYFADTNGVTTTIYYPKTMEKDLKTPHDADRWRHIASKLSPDNGVAKEMKQQQLADEYHQEYPECTHIGTRYH